MVRASLPHAKDKWLHAISTYFWLFVVSYANNICNSLLAPGSTKSRIEKFSNIFIRSNLDFCYTFSCPAFILDTKQLGRTKWDSSLRGQNRVGIFYTNYREKGILLLWVFWKQYKKFYFHSESWFWRVLHKNIFH